MRTKEIMNCLNITRETLRVWIRKGKIKGNIVGYLGHDIPVAEIRRYLLTCNDSLPDWFEEILAKYDRPTQPDGGIKAVA